MEFDDETWRLDLDTLVNHRSAPPQSLSGAGLVILSGDRAGRRFRVRGEVVLGRGEDCHIHFDAADVSRRHARVGEDDLGFFVEDLGSQNGTCVNNAPAMGRQRLSYGDRITLAGRTVILFTSEEDVDERLTQRDRMEAIARLAGSIAHDFNNLFGAVLTNLDYLAALPAESKVGDTTVAEAHRDIEAGIRRAAELTSSLAVFSGTPRPREERVDLSDLLEEVVGLSRRSCEGIEIETSIEPYIEIHGDSSQLHRAIMNLVINAREAMPEGGRLRIAGSACREDASSSPIARIVVEDTGVGMSEDVRAKLFEPFFTTKKRGNGLGLAAVYGIVRQHSGEIHVDSEPGKGSRFTVDLPALEADWVEPSTADLGSNARPITILIIDDDPLALRATKRLLQTLGHEVEATDQGDRGVAMFRERLPRTFDLVLVDLVMPKMSGIEVATLLREASSVAKILAMSGHGSQTQLEAFRATTDGFIAKPFSVEALKKAIDEVVGKSRRLS